MERETVFRRVGGSCSLYVRVTAQASFSYVSPSSAVFQVVIGGGVGGGFIGGAGAPAAKGAADAAPAEPAPEEKKEEKEESDEDMGFSLFD